MSLMYPIYFIHGKELVRLEYIFRMRLSFMTDIVVFHISYSIIYPAREPDHLHCSYLHVHSKTSWNLIVAMSDVRWWHRRRLLARYRLFFFKTFPYTFCILFTYNEVVKIFVCMLSVWFGQEKAFCVLKSKLTTLLYIMSIYYLASSNEFSTRRSLSHVGCQKQNEMQQNSHWRETEGWKSTVSQLKIHSSNDMVMGPKRKVNFYWRRL